MPSALPRQIESTRLANGMLVVTERMLHVRSVAVGVWVGAGSRQESPADSGISHFLEHMLFKGTPRRSAEAIAREVDSIGGNLDAFTAKEMVSFNTKVLDAHLPRAFDILADLVLNPLMREEDVEKEKSVILEELKMELDNPEYIVHETFLSRFWKGHALGRPIIGTQKTIRSFTASRLSDYHERIYQPSNLLITAAGNLEHEEMLRLVEANFSHLRPGKHAGTGKTPGTHGGVTFKKKRLQQVHLCLGAPSCSLTDDRRYASYLLNTILGGGMSSRLFQNIREKQGLAYAVFSELNMFRDSGCLAVYAGTSKENAGKVIESVMAELSMLKTEPVPAEELQRAKDHLKGSLMLSLESTSSRMANLARQEMYFGRHFSFEELTEGIDQVTADHLMELSRDAFRQEQLALTVLGSPEGFEPSQAALVC